MLYKSYQEQNMHSQLGEVKGIEETEINRRLSLPPLGKRVMSDTSAVG